jgi:hypothetical protein
MSAAFPLQHLRAIASSWLGVALSVFMATTRGDAAALKSAEMADSMTCRTVESAAAFAGVPVTLLTRLVWTESRFQAGATSPAGAEGIAQFMPETASERGLTNPFNPDEAITNAAELLADMALRFGNIGLATAAYNAGPNRVEKWLAGVGSLARETRAYVFALTGHTVEDWTRDRQGQARAEDSADQASCIAIVASLRAKEGEHALVLAPDLPFERNFLTAIAIAKFEKARQRFCQHFDPHWHIAATRPASASDDLLPPLCSTYLR